jgi:hypothetical protein
MSVQSTKTGNQSPIVQPRQLSAKPESPLVKAAGRQWRRFVAAITTPDLLAVVIFCLIGLLLALNLILRFPDFGAVIEQSNLF